MKRQAKEKARCDMRSRIGSGNKSSTFFRRTVTAGNQWKDHRTMINGILWILRTGAPWRDLPKEFGPWKTVYERFRLWSRDGFWDTLLSDLKVKKNRKGKINWRLFCIDGTVIRAHKASAGAEKKWA